MSLKTDYKNDMFSGKRKYQITENDDSTISLDDVTSYEQQGDVFSADDINTTNQAVNDLNDSLNAFEDTFGGFQTETNQKIADVKTVKAALVPASGWSSTSPYTQTVPIDGVASNDTPVADLYLGDNPNSNTVKARKKAWACLDRYATGNGNITLYCYEEKPNTDFTIRLKGE